MSADGCDAGLRAWTLRRTRKINVKFVQNSLQHMHYRYDIYAYLSHKPLCVSGKTSRCKWIQLYNDTRYVTECSVHVTIFYMTQLPGRHCLSLSCSSARTSVCCSPWNLLLAPGRSTATLRNTLLCVGAQGQQWQLYQGIAMTYPHFPTAFRCGLATQWSRTQVCFLRPIVLSPFGRNGSNGCILTVIHSLVHFTTSRLRTSIFVRSN
jgi:hypothetical protein